MAEYNPGSSSSSGTNGSHCSDSGSHHHFKQTLNHHTEIKPQQGTGTLRHDDHVQYQQTPYNTQHLHYFDTRNLDDNIHSKQITTHSTRHNDKEVAYHANLSNYHQSMPAFNSLNRNNSNSNSPVFDERFQTNRSADRKPTVLYERHGEQAALQSFTDEINPYKLGDSDRASIRTRPQQEPRYERLQTGSPEQYQPYSQLGNRDEIQVRKVICFNMDKCNKIGSAYIQKFNVTSSTLSIQSVANVLRIDENNIRIVDTEELPVGHPARTIVIIARNALTSSQFIIVEILIRSDQPYPELICFRLPVDGISVNELSAELSRELSVKKVVMCENGCLLGNETVIRNHNGQILRLVAVHNTRMTIKCVHQPANNVKSKYEIEADAGTNIRLFKQEFLKTFKENIHLEENQTVHFSLKDWLLGDDTCLGVVTLPSRERVFQVHVASARAICVNLEIKETVGKKTQKARSITIEPDMSTAVLREEVSKHMAIDPKAVKLTVNNRRIEEVDRISEIGGIENGCKLIAGIKKRKAIRVKDAGTQREESFCMFMLEPVHVLKRMVAEKFNIDPLHVSLVYKGRRMAGRDILLTYPIKNQTEINLHVYPKRIKVNVYIVSNKTRTVILVNDADKTTVDDLVRFCAITYNFDHRCARAQFCNRCLSTSSTLTEEDLQSNRTVVIVFFDQPELLDGGLIRIFSVRPDGQINERLGAVSGGYLLHASKKVKTNPSCCYPKECEQLPEGIRVYEESHVVEDDAASIEQPKKPSLPKASPVRDSLSTANLKALRRKYIARARRVKANSNTHTRSSPERTLPPRSPHQPRPELISAEDTNRPGALVSPVDSLNVPEFSYDSETDLKKVYIPKKESKSPTEEDGATTNIAERVSCIEDCCTHIKHAIDIPSTTENPPRHMQTINQIGSACGISSDQMVRNSESFITEETGEGMGKPAFGDTSGSASDLQTVYRNVEFTLGSESSDQEPDNRLRQRQLFGAADFNRCPYMQQLRYPRRRTRTEGEVALPELRIERMQHNSTYPLLPRWFPSTNEWLNTAGITIDILNTVSRKIGRKWKPLARKLSVSEDDIENIDASGDKELHEKAFAVILHWKKSKGQSASKERLIQALKDIEMLAVAEYIEQYCDYRTV